MSVIAELSVGVLCIQGAFAEHLRVLRRVADKRKDMLRVRVVEVRKPEQLSGLDGLIVPGGESTTLSVFLAKNGFEEALRCWLSRRRQPRPGVLWGTCAGLILLANALTEQKKGGQVTIGGLDVECSRNVYGSQVSSFEAPVTLHPPAFHAGTSADSTTTTTSKQEDKDGKNNGTGLFHGIFIRAPGITQVTSPEVQVLGTLEPQGTVVAVQQGNLIATTFHPELTADTRWHEYFIDQIISQQ